MKLQKQAQCLAATGFTIHPKIPFARGWVQIRHKRPCFQAMGRSSDQATIDLALCRSTAGTGSNFWPANSHNNAKRYIAPASR